MLNKSKINTVVIFICTILVLFLGVYSEAADTPTKIEFKLAEDDSRKDELIFGEEILLSTEDIATAELVIKEPAQKDAELFKNTGFKPKTTVGISLTFNEEGSKKLLNVTTKHAKKRLAIFIDGKFLQAPKIFGPIEDGRMLIMANFSEEEAKSIVDRINNQQHQ